MTGKGPVMESTATLPVSDRRRGSFLPVTTAFGRGRWGTSLFGIVPAGAVRRRPSDAFRVVAAVLLVTVAASSQALGTTRISQGFVAFLDALPGGLTEVFEVLYRAGQVLGLVLLVASLLARRPRLLFTLLLAGLVALGLAAAIGELVSDPDLGDDLTRLAGATPDFPVILLTASSAVLLAARPFVTRPARRVIELAFWCTALNALYLLEGLPGAVVASLILAWGTAAFSHLCFGSPAGVPTTGQVEEALRDLGLEVDGLDLDPDQAWGNTTFVSHGPDPLTVEVLGRDATDARVFAKLWRFAWYKDSGPTLMLRRSAQVEHDALVLLLAERSGARVPELAAVGLAGSRDDALLAVRNPHGRPLDDIDPEQVTDAVLDDAWQNLGALHDAGIAHGNLTGRRLVIDDQGRTGLVRLGRAETSAPDDHLALDAVQLLVLSAQATDTDRALAAGQRALGTDGLAALLPFLDPAAVTGRSRSGIDDLKGLLAELREGGSQLTGTEIPATAALRRFSLGGILLAAAFALGVYLLVAQLAGVAAMGDVFAGAIWGWVAATAVLAQLPQLSQAVAMIGSVAATLPLRPVAMVQFAQAFTGLVGGTAGNATLTIRFFQKQGLAPAVAVSSGVLNSLAGFAVQAVLLTIGILATGGSFDFGGEGGAPSWLLPVAIAAAAVVLVVLVVPKLRRRIASVATRQLHEALDNIRGIVSTPRKAVELFGGNLVSQFLFAMTLGAALHAYGESLPLLQIVVINSLASLVGGVAPVPGGMGVVESGLIAGFTAAGIPQAEAVATTFTARMFTTYLPPTWGWFAFQSLRHREYI